MKVVAKKNKKKQIGSPSNPSPPPAPEPEPESSVAPKQMPNYLNNFLFGKRSPSTEREDPSKVARRGPKQYSTSTSWNTNP